MEYYFINSINGLLETVYTSTDKDDEHSLSCTMYSSTGKELWSENYVSSEEKTTMIRKVLTSHEKKASDVFLVLMASVNLADAMKELQEGFKNWN